MSAWGKTAVISRHSSPRRIIAVSNSGETSSLDHQAIVTAIARIAVPAVTGYRGISVHFGAVRIVPNVTAPASVAQVPARVTAKLETEIAGDTESCPYSI